MLKKVKKAVIKIQRLLTGIKRNRVCFISFGGKSYSDNPRYISEALHKISPDTEIVWAFTNPNDKENVVPDYVRMVNCSNAIKYFDMFFSSAVWVTNNGMPYMGKKKNQFYIQTWHGDRAFKKVLYDANPNNSSYFRSEAVDGYCNLAIAGSEYGKKQYISAFKYKGEIMMEGTPRNDILVKNDRDYAAKIRASLGLDESKKILLYAPTLRCENATLKSAQQARFDIEKTLEVLNKKSEADWVCLMRAHPSVCALSGVDYSDKIIDASKYEDMAELLLIADMLITDYSSCAGDFALTGRPIILFQGDINEYLEKEREFYFEMSDSPYYIVSSQSELEAMIDNLDFDDAKINCKQILDFYKTSESGHASEAVAKRIVEWLKKIQ